MRFVATIPGLAVDCARACAGPVCARMGITGYDGGAPRRIRREHPGETQERACPGSVGRRTGGGAAFINTWVVEGEDPLDPEELTDRLIRMVSVVTAVIHSPSTITTDKEQAR